MRAKELLPQVTAVHFPGVGHRLHLQSPKPVLSAVQVYLDALSNG